MHKGLKDKASSQSSEAVKSFATNWSSPDFVKFVDDLASLVDSLGINPGTAAWRRAEEIWVRVIELEEGFWPNEGEEYAMRRD